MEYLIVILVIAVALAPLSHVLPSKRQRKVARMREYAAVHGLFVEFRNLPGSPRSSPGARPGSIVYYGKRLPPPRGGATRRAYWLVDEQGWRGPDIKQPPPQLLSGLPSTILAASVDEGSCGAYWQESDEEEDVEEIRAVLEGWAEQLTS